MRPFLATILCMLCAASALGQNEAEVKTTSLDADTTERLGPLRVDTMGRLFAAGRTAIFVYEPTQHGGYRPRRLLCRFPDGSDIRDVELRGNDLYILTRSALYLIPDGARKHERLQAQKLIWGVPLSHADQGFDAMAWGPQGDLYFTVRVPLSGTSAHWIFASQPAGTKVAYNGIGGVLRCKPDGSALQVVAGGLRTPRGLVFDHHWNLFTCDAGAAKDAPWRMLHVTPHAHLEPSGSVVGAIAAPKRADLLEPMLETAPGETFACLSYYDDPLLPATFRHNLLGARNRKLSLTRYPIKPRGASFQTSEHSVLPGKDTLSVHGMTVGPDGRVFATFADSDTADGQSATRELVTTAPSAAAALPPLDPYDAAEAPVERLWRELSEASWQRRYRAHVELTRRAGNVFRDASKRLIGARVSDPAFHSLVWLAALARKPNPHLVALADHADPLVRVQTLRALTECPEVVRDEPIFTKPLLDENAQVQHTAVLAYFSPKVHWDSVIQDVVERGPACSKDTYLRQSATLLLAEKATLKRLESLCGRFDAPTRLAGVLAAGFRLTLPAATRSLGPHLPLVKPRDESLIIDYADGKFDLRNHGRVGEYTLAEHWKADMHTAEQELTFKLLRKMLADPDEPVRVQSALFLSRLGDARTQKDVARILTTK